MLAQAGRIDILINNAGLSSYTPGIDVSDEELRQMFGMNGGEGGGGRVEGGG